MTSRLFIGSIIISLILHWSFQYGFTFNISTFPVPHKPEVIFLGSFLGPIEILENNRAPSVAINNTSFSTEIHPDNSLFQRNASRITKPQSSSFHDAQDKVTLKSLFELFQNQETSHQNKDTPDLEINRDEITHKPLKLSEE